MNIIQEMEHTWCLRFDKQVEQNKTRYDYNLTIMKSPKPATDNLFKK